MSTIDNRDFFSKMLTLAIPIALQQLLVSCAQLVDTAMVVGLGNDSTAAIGIAGRWAFLLNLAVFGVSSGVSTLIAQHWGVRDLHNIHRAYGAGIIVAAFAGSIYCLGTLFAPEQMMRIFTDEQRVIDQGVIYLRSVSLYGIFFSLSQITSTSMRSTEDVKTPLFCAIASVLTNVLLNYVLIGGHWGFPALGLRGAALATVTAMGLQLLLMVILGYARRNIMFSNWRDVFCFDRDFLGRFFRISVPVIINEFMWGFGTNIYTMVFARQGSENFAAYTIFSTIEQVAFVFFMGVCSASSVMVGKTVGAGRPKEAYHMGKRFILLMPIIGLILSTILITCRYPILSLLDIETAGAVHTTAALMVVYSLWLPLRNLPYICIVGIFRAGGDTKIGMILDIICLFVISIPIVSYLGLCTEIAFPLLVATMYVAEDTLKIIACLIHFFRKTWIRQLTGAGITEEA